MDEIILKYLQNDLKPEEAELLDQWLKEGNNKLILYNIEMHWLHNRDFLDASKQKVWERISLPPSGEKKHRTFPFRTWLRVAAVLVVGLFTGYFIISIFKAPDDIHSGNIRYTERVSLPGQKISLMLPDGSKVKLNAGSKLIMPERFDSHHRKVELVGEAYFEIARDESRPFTVQTAHINIDVLGTSFNVRAYDHEAPAQVAVAHGKVSVSGKKNKDRIVLVKDQLATWDAEELTVTDGFNWKEILSWKDQTLYFNQQNIAEIIDRLELWYGVTIRLEKKLDMKSDFSGEYRNKSLQTVLDGLAYVYGFEYKINEDMVILK